MRNSAMLVWDIELSYIAFELRDGRKFILFRMERKSSRGSGAPCSAPTRRSKVLFRVFCASVTFVAVPTISAADADDWPEGQGVKPWKRPGARSPRYPAARLYKNRNGQIPSNWFWAATASGAPAPDLLADLPTLAPPVDARASSQPPPIAS